MDKALFGSTCSLGGLLNDTLFSECEADQFLGELDCPVSKGMAFFPAMETASGADSLGSNLTGDQGQQCCTLLNSGIWPSGYVA